MGKGNTMTLSMIHMYEELIKDDFAPMIRILKARGEAVKDSILVEVKKDMGLYDLLLKKAQLEFEMAEVVDTLRRKTEKVRTDDGLVDPIDSEVERRMEVINAPLKELVTFTALLMRDIKLSTGTPEVRALFEKLPEEISSWKKKVEELPPLKVKALSEKDRTLLGISVEPKRYY